MTEPIRRNNIATPRPILTRPTFMLTKALAGFNRHSIEVHNLEPGGRVSEKINVLMGAHGIHISDVDDPAKIIFSDRPAPDLLDAAKGKLKAILENVGFEANILRHAQSRMLLALIQRWDEVEKLSNFPDNVKRQLIIVPTDNSPHTTCLHNQGIALVKIGRRFLSPGSKIDEIDDEIVSALGVAREVILIHKNDKTKRAELARMIHDAVDPERIARSAFIKKGVLIRYSSSVHTTRVFDIHRQLDVQKLIDALYAKGVRSAISGIIVDHCSHSHHPFMEFDSEKGLVLIMTNEPLDYKNELPESIYGRIFPTEIELWMEGHGKENRTDDFQDATTIKAVRTLRG